MSSLEEQEERKISLDGLDSRCGIFPLGEGKNSRDEDLQITIAHRVREWSLPKRCINPGIQSRDGIILLQDWRRGVIFVYTDEGKRLVRIRLRDHLDKRFRFRDEGKRWDSAPLSSSRVAVLLPQLRTNEKETGCLVLIFDLTPPSYKLLDAIAPIPDIHLGAEFRVLENRDGDLLICNQHSIFVYGKDVVYSLTGEEEMTKILDLLPHPGGGYLVLTSRSLLMAGEKTRWYQRRVIVLHLNEDWEIIREWDTDFAGDAEFSLDPGGSIIVCGKGAAVFGRRGRSSITVYSPEGKPLHYALGDPLNCCVNSAYLGSGKLAVRTAKHTLRIVDLLDHSTRGKSPLFR